MLGMQPLAQYILLITVSSLFSSNNKPDDYFSKVCLAGMIAANAVHLLYLHPSTNGHIAFASNSCFPFIDTTFQQCRDRRKNVLAAHKFAVFLCNKARNNSVSLQHLCKPEASRAY